MVEPANQSASRAWYKLHGTTLLAVVIVGAAIAYTQWGRQGGIGAGNTWGSTTSYWQGWPVICCTTKVVEMTYVSNSAQPNVVVKSIDYTWETYGLVIDSIASLLLIVSTAFVCERGRRRWNRRPQFSLRSLLVAISIATCVLALVSKKFEIYWWLPESVIDAPNLLHESMREYPWYTAGPLVFSLGCAIYSILWLAIQATTKTIGLLVYLFRPTARTSSW